MPIDQHRGLILDTVNEGGERVTIIRAETGAGKSTRLPLFLAAEDDRARIVMSQPRRLAAKGVAERLRTSMLEDGTFGPSPVGLRLGHGTSAHSSRLNRVTLATAGYLVQRATHDPDYLGTFSHLIIDEVHERSVDVDLLCLLAKDALVEHPHLKLVIMSATVDARPYCKYFEVGMHRVLSVGERRFPVRAHFLDEMGFGDTLQQDFSKLQRQQQRLNDLGQHAVVSVPPRVVQAQLGLVPRAIAKIAAKDPKGGYAILVFLSGMQDIEQLHLSLSNMRIDGSELLVLAIHSDLLLDDQMKALEPAPAGVIKVVLATNAAESSLTIPDADHVICLGSHKQLQLDVAGSNGLGGQRTRLVQTFIPVSSMIQRAGRTGRVRPGRVYRLYPKQFANMMPAHEPPEVTRMSLAELVLQLKRAGGVNRPVRSILSRLLDPPDPGALDDSFKLLERTGVLSSVDDDEAELTKLGRFVAALNVDISTAFLLLDAYLLDLVPEVLILAAQQQAGKSIFWSPTPMHLTPQHYNRASAQAAVRRAVLEDGSFSDHVASINAIALFEQRTEGLSSMDSGIIASRAVSLLRIAKSVGQRLAGAVCAANDETTAEPRWRSFATLYDHPERVMRLRLLLRWHYGHTTLLGTQRRGGRGDTDVVALSVGNNMSPRLAQEVEGLWSHEQLVGHLGRLPGSTYESVREVVSDRITTRLVVTPCPPREDQWFPPAAPPSIATYEPSYNAGLRRAYASSGDGFFHPSTVLERLVHMKTRLRDMPVDVLFFQGDFVNLDRKEGHKRPINYDSMRVKVGMLIREDCDIADALGLPKNVVEAVKKMEWTEVDPPRPPRPKVQRSSRRTRKQGPVKPPPPPPKVIPGPKYFMVKFLLHPAHLEALEQHLRMHAQADGPRVLAALSPISCAQYLRDHQRRSVHGVAKFKQMLGAIQFLTNVDPASLVTLMGPLDKGRRRRKNRPKRKPVTFEEVVPPPPAVFERRRDVLAESSTLMDRVAGSISKGHFQSQHLEIPFLLTPEKAFQFRVDLPVPVTLLGPESKGRVLCARFSFMDNLRLEEMQTIRVVCSELQVLGADGDSFRAGMVTAMVDCEEWEELAKLAGGVERGGGGAHPELVSQATLVGQRLAKARRSFGLESAEDGSDTLVTQIDDVFKAWRVEAHPEIQREKLAARQLKAIGNPDFFELEKTTQSPAAQSDTVEPEVQEAEVN